MKIRTTVFVVGAFLVLGGASAQRIPEAFGPFEEEALPAEELPEELADTAPAVAAGQTLYGVGLDLSGSSASHLYRINNHGVSPQAQVIGDTGVGLFDLAIDPISGRFYGLGSDGYLYELNPATGQAIRLGHTGRSDINSLEFDATGEAWGWGASSGNFYHIDKEVGLATEIGDTGFSSGGDLAFDTDGTLYGTTTDRLIRINRSTGAGTPIGSSLGFSGAFGLEIDSDGTMYVGRGSNSSGLAQLYRVNKSTGTTTFIGSISGAGSYGLTGLAFAGAPPGQALFLQNGRFKVEVDWFRGGESGAGQPVQLTADTGYFWFFAASNVEFLIKILDGCGLNGRFWVFAGGLTDVRVEILVTDMGTGLTKRYSNPQGKPFQPIQDTAAFGICGL